MKCHNYNSTNKMRLPDHILNRIDPRYLCDFNKICSSLLSYGVSEAEIERLFSTPDFSIYTTVRNNRGDYKSEPNNPEKYLWYYKRTLVELQLNENEMPVIYFEALPLNLYKEYHEPSPFKPRRKDFDKSIVLTIYHNLKDINRLSGVVDAINSEPPFRVISYSAFPEDKYTKRNPHLRAIKVRIETEIKDELPNYCSMLHDIIPDCCKRILWKDDYAVYYDALFCQGFPLTEAGIIVEKFKSVEQVESILIQNGYADINVIEQDKGWLKITFSCKYLYEKDLCEQMNKAGIKTKVYGDKDNGFFIDAKPSRSHWIVVSKNSKYSIDDESSMMSGIAGGFGEHWGRD